MGVDYPCLVSVLIYNLLTHLNPLILKEASL